MHRLETEPLSLNRDGQAPRLSARTSRLALLLAALGATTLFPPRVARAQQSTTNQTSAPVGAGSASSTPPPPPPPSAEPANLSPAAGPAAKAPLAPLTALAVTPIPAPAPAIAAKPRAVTDHTSVVRHVGIGFIGISELPLPVASPTGTKGDAGLSPNDRIILRRVAAPALGARMWLSKRFGVDAGIGFSYSAGSASSTLGGTRADVDKQSVLAFLLHAGAPVMIADIKHMSLLVVPEATFGLARSNVAPIFSDNAPPEAELRGARLDVGVRAGAEVHFGFMGLPRLSLEAGVGLLFTAEWASATVGNQSTSDVAMRITTTSFNDPWDIFGGFASIAARYYF